MYIGLISDTHGVFDGEFRGFLAPVDQLWHAGDFGGGVEFADSIRAFKPLTAVHGNCDGQDIRLEYPAVQNFECGGMKVLMTHIGGSPGHYDLRVHGMLDALRPDLFVCGHSHILKVMRDESHDLLYVNPGAAGIQGWHVVRTALRFRIEGGQVSDMEVFELPRVRH